MAQMWIKTYDNAIPDELCNSLIELFEDESTPKGDLNYTWRRCTEYSKLDSSKYWLELNDVMAKSYQRYREDMKCGIFNFINYVEAPNMFRYNVDKENPNYFNNHADCWNYQTSTRQISIIIYLNDVEEGGGTNFYELNTLISPKKGRIVLFPSFYMFMHRGEPPLSDRKYIIVTWLHFDISPGVNHAYRTHKLT